MTRLARSDWGFDGRAESWDAHAPCGTTPDLHTGLIWTRHIGCGDWCAHLTRRTPALAGRPA